MARILIPTIFVVVMTTSVSVASITSAQESQTRYGKIASLQNCKNKKPEWILSRGGWELNIDSNTTFHAACIEATVNAPSVNAVKAGRGQVFIEEDNYDNNTVAIKLQIEGDNVKEPINRLRRGSDITNVSSASHITRRHPRPSKKYSEGELQGVYAILAYGYIQNLRFVNTSSDVVFCSLVANGFRFSKRITEML